MSGAARAPRFGGAQIETHKLVHHDLPRPTEHLNARPETMPLFAEQFRPANWSQLASCPPKFVKSVLPQHTAAGTPRHVNSTLASSHSSALQSLGDTAKVLWLTTRGTYDDAFRGVGGARGSHRERDGDRGEAGAARVEGEGCRADDAGTVREVCRSCGEEGTLNLLVVPTVAREELGLGETGGLRGA